MRPIQQAGVFTDGTRNWTKSRVEGKRIYGESLRKVRGTEYRSWSAHRSKMSALLARDPQTEWIKRDEDVLYLGASTGTSVSHLSDILDDEARLYAVEFSPRSGRDLLWNVEDRVNVVPILSDAGEPSNYWSYIDREVGAIVQDVAQRHQVAIMIRNLPALRKGGLVFLFIKARSIDVTKPVEIIQQEVARQVVEAGLTIVKEIRLDPFEKDHVAFILRK